MKKFLRTLLKSILLALLATILIPVIYFSWRAGQPMELSEYNGLTYYQYIEWRKMAYEDSVTKYQIDHPEKVIERPWSCIGAELLIQNTTSWYVSGVILFAQGHPEISRTWTAEELGMIPGHDITWYNYLPELWRAREHLIWSNAKHAPQLPSPYCRIQPNVPTLEEFQTIKFERELSVATR